MHSICSTLLTDAQPVIRQHTCPTQFCKRPSFGLPKAAFHALKDGLSPCKTPPFIKQVATSCLSSIYGTP